MKKLKKVIFVVLVFIALLIPFGYFMAFDRNKGAISDDINSDPTSNQTYTITWKNYDNTTLAIETYKFGDIPSFKGKEPKKETENLDFLYKFSGWVPELVGVSQNAEYVAKYDEIDNRLDNNSFFNNGEVNYSFAKLVQDNYITTSPANSEILSINDSFNQLEPGTLTIPSTIKIIGEQAFSNCTSLREVILSSNIETIKNRAFSNCTNLTKFDYSKSAYFKPVYKDYIFEDCTSLVDVILPENSLSLTFGQFKGCTSLETFNVPKDVQSIGNRCFEGCTKLKNINIANEEIVTSDLIINNGAFVSCNAITSFTFNKRVKQILPTTFQKCENLEYIIVSDSVTLVNKHFVSECNKFNKVFYFGESVDKWNSILNPNNEEYTYNVYIYSATRPENNIGSYWHYSDNTNLVPEIWQ